MTARFQLVGALLLLTPVQSLLAVDIFPFAVIQVVITPGEQKRLFDALVNLGSRKGYTVRNLGSGLSPPPDPESFKRNFPLSEERDILWLQFIWDDEIHMRALDYFDGERFSVAIYEGKLGPSSQRLTQALVEMLKENGWFSSMRYHAPNKALQPTPESDRAAFGGSFPGRRG